MPLEQNEPRSVKTSARKRRRWVVALPVGLLGLLLGGTLLYWYGFRPQEIRPKPPAPDAPKARSWTPEAKKPFEEQVPTYQWPDDFELPLQIIIEDVPEVPERIKGPSPMEEEMMNDEL